MKSKSLKPLAITFALGGVWDTFAAIQYLFLIGTGRAIDNPATDTFYAVFLGSFFICFAWLQFLSAFNIRRYAFNVGCLIIGRLFYVILLYSNMMFKPGFPSTFWFTGIIDGTFILLHIIFAFRGGLKTSDLLLPKTKL
jgi:hypothetical protein